MQRRQCGLQGDRASGRLGIWARAFLWIQQKVRDKEIQLTKVPGKDNPGDSFTKYLSGPEIRTHLDRMGLQHEEGRPDAAPTL